MFGLRPLLSLVISLVKDRIIACVRTLGLQIYTNSAKTKVSRPTRDADDGNILFAVHPEEPTLLA